MSVVWSSQSQSLQLQLSPDFHGQPNVEYMEFSTVIYNSMEYYKQIKSSENDLISKQGKLLALARLGDSCMILNVRRTIKQLSQVSWRGWKGMERLRNRPSVL